MPKATVAGPCRSAGQGMRWTACTILRFRTCSGPDTLVPEPREPPLPDLKRKPGFTND